MCRAGGMTRTGGCQRVVNVKKRLRWPVQMASPSLPAIPHLSRFTHSAGRQSLQDAGEAKGM